MERRGIGWYVCPMGCGEFLANEGPVELEFRPEPDADPDRHQKTLASMLRAGRGGGKSGKRRKKVLPKQHFRRGM